MGGAPAGAVRGDEEVRRELGERVARRPDDRLERAPAEMEATQDEPAALERLTVGRSSR